MATTRYHNEGSTDWANAASWRTETFGGSAVPVDTDSVYFDGGSDNVSSNVDQTGIDLATLAFTSGFSGRVGAGSSPLIIGVNAAVGLGSGILEYGAGGGVAYVKADPTNGIDIVRVTGAGHLYLVGGTINTKAEITRGQLSIDENTVLSAKIVNIWGGETVIDYKADGTPPTINVYGGTVFIRRRCTLNLKGGNVVFQVEKSTSDSTVTQDGGMLDWRAGNLALTGNAGTLTFANAIKPVAISAATIGAGHVIPIDGRQGRGVAVTYPTITFAGETIPAGYTKA